MILRVLQGMAGLLLLAQASMASAVLTIEIIGAGEHQIPVSLVPFGGDEKIAQAIVLIVIAGCGSQSRNLFTASKYGFPSPQLNRLRI